MRDTMTWANNALQRTRLERRGCNHGVPWAGSLSLGRSTGRAGRRTTRQLTTDRGLPRRPLD